MVSLVSSLGRAPPNLVFHCLSSRAEFNIDTRPFVDHLNTIPINKLSKICMCIKSINSEFIVIWKLSINNSLWRAHEIWSIITESFIPWCISHRIIFFLIPFKFTSLFYIIFYIIYIINFVKYLLKCHTYIFAILMHMCSIILRFF